MNMRARLCEITLKSQWVKYLSLPRSLHFPISCAFYVSCDVFDIRGSDGELPLCSPGGGQWWEVWRRWQSSFVFAWWCWWSFTRYQGMLPLDCIQKRPWEGKQRAHARTRQRAVLFRSLLLIIIQRKFNHLCVTIKFLLALFLHGSGRFHI